MRKYFTLAQRASASGKKKKVRIANVKFKKMKMSKYMIFFYLIWLSCNRPLSTQINRSNNISIKEIEIKGVYMAKFTYEVFGLDTTFWYQSTEMKLSNEKSYILELEAENLNNNCKGISENKELIINNKILENKEHPKYSPGYLFNGINTYFNTKNKEVIVSFKINGRGSLVTQLCSQYYSFFNSSNCKQITNHDTILVVTTIDSTSPLTIKEISERDLVPFKRMGFVFKTCN